MKEHACTYEHSLSWHSLCVYWFSQHCGNLIQHITCLGALFKSKVKPSDEPYTLLDHITLDPNTKQPIVYFLKIQPASTSISPTYNLTIGFVGNNGIFTNVSHGKSVLVSETTRFPDIPKYLISIKSSSSKDNSSHIDDELVPVAILPELTVTDCATSTVSNISNDCTPIVNDIPEASVDNIEQSEKIVVPQSMSQQCFTSSGSSCVKRKKKNRRLRRVKEFAITSRQFAVTDGYNQFCATCNTVNNSYIFTMQQRLLRDDSMPFD